MKTKVKTMWVTALRSGEFLQGRESLVAPGDDGALQYCCLGVLCELAARANVIQHASEYESNFHSMAYGEEPEFLPHAVVKWAGLDSVSPIVTGIVDNGTPLTQSLAEWNDQRYTFAEIADWIDEQL